MQWKLYCREVPMLTTAPPCRPTLVNNSYVYPIEGALESGGGTAGVLHGAGNSMGQKHVEVLQTVFHLSRVSYFILR